MTPLGYCALALVAIGVAVVAVDVHRLAAELRRHISEQHYGGAQEYDRPSA